MCPSSEAYRCPGTDDPDTGGWQRFSSLLLETAETEAHTHTCIELVMEHVIHECLDDLQNTWRLTGFPVLVFATASDTSRVPSGVLSCFKHEVAFEVTSNFRFYSILYLMGPQAPNELERYEILDALLAESSLAYDVSLSTLATHTAALVASDLVDLVERAHLLSIERVMSTA